jgi:peptide/nickel transport system permease protein
MRFIAARLLHSLFVLLAVVTLMFLMFRLMPGDPMAAYISETLSEESRQSIRAQFGLDRPLWQQYLIYLGNLCRGELGMSFFLKEPVWNVVMTALPNTLALTFSALLLAYLFGVVVGAFLAWQRGSLFEGITIPVVLATRAAPEFWVGMILLSVFAFSLGWFPSGGAASPGAMYASEWQRMLSLDFLHHLALPVLTLALYLQGLPLLLMRSTMLDVMHEEYVTMARMKGLSTRRIVLHHAARNAMLPVATAFALSLGQLVGGNVVVEIVFSWPGLGRILVQAVAASDYPLAQGAFLLVAFALISMNFVADLFYALLDPRVSHERKA